MIIYLSCGVTARERTDSIGQGDGGDLVVSVVTCAPGPDVYELCGHAAIRIRNERMDSVWNYGVFDFTSPNFIYRFCKGETDYMLRGYQFSRFMPAYVHRGSRVIEQVLDLSQDEARTLMARLNEEALPENRVYRYNYVRDNCATRPLKRVKEVSEKAVSLPDTLYFPTFREEMRYFHHNYPWYQFGIDLVLGSGLDYPLDKDEDTFAPPVLSAKLASATVDGRPFVKETNMIFPGYVDATLPPTPWYLTPMAVGVLMFAVSFGAFFVYLLRGRLWRWWISLYFFVAGVAGCIVAFLVFFSEHEATSPNLMLFWLNPLQLIIATGIWFRSWRWPVVCMAAYDLAMAVILTLLWPTPLVAQVSNPAIWPMLLSVIPLSVTVLARSGVIRLNVKNV